MVLYDAKAPGVYIEEISGGARPIQAVGTSTAGFVGVIRHPEVPIGEAIAVNNWLQFVRTFRLDPGEDVNAARDVLAQIDALEKRAQALQAKSSTPPAPPKDEEDPPVETDLSKGEKAPAGTDPPKEEEDPTAETGTPITQGSDFEATFQGLLSEAQAALQEAQGALQKARVAQAGSKAAQGKAGAAREKAEAALEKASSLEETVTKAGGPGTPLVEAVYGFFLNGGTRCYVVNIGTADGATIETGLDALAKRDQIAIVAAPGYRAQADYQAVIDHCEALKDRVAILDPPLEVSDVDALTLTARPPSSNFATFYYPWLQVRDPLSGETTYVPPSGHVAGIWARTDAERGVHKAPANTRVRGAIGLKALVSDDEQGMLNQAGVNCIRSFTGQGILVWGARTLASDPEWRYLNVRRLLNMIEESIATSTRWIVFEPNDAPLWSAIRRDVSAFLTRVWRSGALQGTMPEQAFFVKCDQETNPPENIDAGVVTTVIGVAPVKPAEFVVFQIRQYRAAAETEVQGG